MDLTLAWDPSDDPAVVGYRLFARELNQNYDYDNALWEGTSTTCTLSGLDQSSTYSFVARAYDAYGNVSTDSNEVIHEPTFVDTDSDGISDSDETALYFTDPADADSDDDGVNDGEELAYWGGNWNTDYDGDGLNNLLDPDADNDGVTDGAEISDGFDPSDPMSKAESFTLEVGEVTVDHNWTYVAFSETFQNPVVVAKSFSSYDSEPGVVRITNIDAAGFEIRIQEWDYLDDIHGEEIVSYIVIEQGTHTLSDGTMVEAHRVDTSVTGAFTPVDFIAPFPVEPVVLATVSTYNGSDAVTTRTQSVTTTGFEVGMQEQELNEPSHTTETISYIAWKPSSGTVNGVAYEVNKTPDEVTDHLSTIVYNQSFVSPPVFVASMQTEDGSHTANVRWHNQDRYAADVNIAEEQSYDSETDHVTEVVGYIVLEK